MQNYPLIRFFIIIFLVFVNGFFVAAEFALVRVRQTRIQELIDQGSSNAKRVLELTKDLNRTTSSAQLGITLASIMLGFLGEAFFSELIEDFMHLIGLEGKISASIISAIGFILGYLIITFLHIVFGELSPKVLSIQKTETIALYCSTPLFAFMKLTSPLLRFFVWVSNSFLTMLGLDVHGVAHGEGFTENELKIIIKESTIRGEMEEYESKLIFNILDFTDQNVKEIFTPRIDIQALAIDASIDDVISVVNETGFSRIPIYQNDFDHMVGFIHIKDIIQYIDRKGKNQLEFRIQDVLRDVIIAHEWKALDDLFKEMQKTKIQLAVIIDEYGLVEGLVSVEDIMESIFGPIIDEFDANDDHQLVEIRDNSIIAGGTISIGSFNEILEENFDTTIKSDDSVTLAGYVLELFESEIPKVGEERSDGKLVYKISQMTENRIDLIEIKDLE